MKNWKYIAMLFVVITSLGFLTSSCGDDDEPGGGGKNELIGRWNLYAYDGIECWWGEYWQVSKNEIKWNNRNQGENTTYSYKKNGNTLTLKCTYASDGSKDERTESKAVYEISNGYLVVVMDDGITRIFTKSR